VGPGSVEDARRTDYRAGAGKHVAVSSCAVRRKDRDTERSGCARPLEYRKRRNSRTSGALGPIACSRAAGELASGGADNTILIWDVATRRSRQLGTYKGTLEHLAMSPDGRMLASCSSFVQGDEPVSNSSGDIRLWDTATGDYRPLDWQRKGRMRRVAFSPTGDILHQRRPTGTTMRFPIARGFGMSATPTYHVWQNSPS